MLGNQMNEYGTASMKLDPAIPIIDLHRHLDGNVRLNTILELSREHNIKLPADDAEGLKPYVQVSEPQISVMAFIEKFRWLTEVMVDEDACRRIAYENVEDALNERIDYIELRFSPWFMAERHRLEPEGVIEAIQDGIEAGRRDFGVKVNLIGILSRTYGPETAWVELDALLRHADFFVALDLAGDEVNFPPALFIDHFRRGREAGWEITIHAGEAAGPESVWDAINLLGATRIGHATHAMEDQALLDYMGEHAIGIEANITSNVQTSGVPNFASHPLRLFLEQDLLATINTDDPSISAIDLRHEFEVAAPAAGLSPEQIHRAQRNSLAIAFMSAEERTNLSNSIVP